MIRNKKLSEEEFFKQRKEVLSQWHTGKEVDLDEAIEYHKNLPPLKNFANKMRYAKEHNEIYASTGMGKATVEEQIELLQYVEEHGKADLLGLSPDSLTRQNDYKAAQQGLEESMRTGKSKLNGLPVVNCGVSGIRRLVESVNCPIQPRYGAADARLCDEILFAGGCSNSSPDLFMDFWQHSAKVSLETVVNTHQYVCRLMGYYTEHGVPMCAGAQGFYAAGIPPSLQTATVIISLLLQVEQGVKHLSVKCAGHGNLVQDVVSSKVRLNLLQEYLDKLGYRDIEMFPGISFNLMQYPVDIGTNFAVVFMNTLMAKLIGAQQNDIRTVAEAKAIPTKEDVADTFRTAKAMENFLQKQKIEIDKKEADIEAQMEEKEVRSILDKVLEFGDGDVLVGAAKAVETGVLDNPFAANRAAAGKVLGIKDSEGAIRYYNTGNLPFSKEIIEYHKEKIAQREKIQGKSINYETLISDLLAVSNGYLV
ncbi:MAG: methylaspartate mutase subunit E [Firmicutes bacterium]|nr:methylaspartate mutase subunit E [Bacillota bacterium]